MDAFLKTAQLHRPGSVVEALCLFAILLATFLAARSLRARTFAILLGGGEALGFLFVGNLALPAALAATAVAVAIRSSVRGGVTVDARAFSRQMAVLLAGLVCYEFMRVEVESEPEPALSNARTLLSFERLIHSQFEGSLQSFASRSDLVLETLNWTYSFLFLAVTAAVLLWLLCTDGLNYRIFRNSLGISAALAVVTIAVFPVAPPRFVAETGIGDTVVAFGRSHHFANEYAAMPSLHVGWMALAGFVLGRCIGGRRGTALGAVPGPIMAATVIVTGNHYWLDGVVGTAFALGPALVLAYVPAASWQRLRARVGRGARAAAATLQNSHRAQFSAASLSALVAFLGIGDLISPGFTDFWGYLIFQMSATLVLLVAAEVIFAPEGGISWHTHIAVVVCGYADVFGTAGGLYAAVDEYDKLTHFLGVAALTAGTYDCVHGWSLKRTRPWRRQTALTIGVGIGVSVGIGWEVYEWLGDRVFQTSRAQGNWDTANDLVFDLLGAMTAAMMLWRFERLFAARRHAPSVPEPANRRGV